jgi:hypothetical protein
MRCLFAAQLTFVFFFHDYLSGLTVCVSGLRVAPRVPILRTNPANPLHALLGGLIAGWIIQPEKCASGSSAHFLPVPIHPSMFIAASGFARVGRRESAQRSA